MNALKSWKVGRLFGVDIKMHWSFPLLFLYVYMTTTRSEGGSPTEGLLAIATVGILFVCVVLHEYGHILMARRFGVATKDIVLLPIGGVARLTSIPRRPLQEFLVAIAGPLVNVVIAAILAVVLWAVGHSLAGVSDTLETGTLPVGSLLDFLQTILVMNIALVLFNLIPAFPMDGGRILRAGLATVFSYLTATKWAARVGKLLAIGFALLALSQGLPMLLVLAAFVWFGAHSESRSVYVREMLGDSTVRDVMMTEFEIVPAEATLGDLVERLLAGSQKDFPIGQGSQLVGMLGRKHLVTQLRRRGGRVRVDAVMQPPLQPIEATLPARAVADFFGRGDDRAIPVQEGGRLVGLATLENLHEFMMCREAITALEEHGETWPPSSAAHTSAEHASAKRTPTIDAAVPTDPDATIAIDSADSPAAR